MKALRNYLDKIKPNFEEGGKFHAFRSVFDGFETFLFVPNATSKSGTHIHDSIDSKRIMSMVVIALVPALLFGMYNVGYQHFHATGATGGFWEMFIYGFLAVLPKIIVSYVVGLGIEFIVAQWKKEEIQEGFLVSGILIPMIVRGIPGYRARIRPIVSRITIHWPSFYNVVTGKTLALPNLIALQHIPLSPAGVIAKRPAPIALPNSCAAEWRMAPDAVFSPYASVRYFTPHMVHSQYNLL